MARLIVNPCSPQARQIALKPGVNRLGRNAENDFSIDDASVSGSHCEVILSDGVVRLRDLGSTNGTFVNGAAVTDANLYDGEQIQLGNVPLVFEASPTTPVDDIKMASRPRGTGPIRISLGTVAEAPRAAPPETPPPPPAQMPAAGSAAVSRNTSCKHHPRTPARWLCTGCGKAFCDVCVAVRPGSQMFCRSCGQPTEQLQVTLVAPRQKTFFRELPRAALYPFRGTGLMIIIAATLLFAALQFMSVGFIGLIVQVIALGYLFSYVQNIIHSTAVDDDELPDLPPMDEVFSGFFKLIGVGLISFGPALVTAWLAIAKEQPTAGIALIPAVIFGCIYFPMAFLAVAIKDTVAAANPLVVAPSILRVPLEYLVTVVLLGAVFGVRWLGDAISDAMAGQALRTTSIPQMFLLFGLRALWAFLSVYLLTVTMRILGLLYLTKSQRLGW
jgi:pSer/pThr/pTyr-binding forkhead associated (FHA) protein